jgi:hypothetical protein
MRNRFLALAATGMALGLGAGPAMASPDDPLSAQTAEQVAGNQQYAESNANSTQYNPSNTNISVRVLSPGDDGDVTQENNSYAGAGATNDNTTAQTVEQTQSGAGGVALQEALQKAGSEQVAKSNAESVQVKPQNKNISVRVLSPGKGGSVEQSNNSEAKSKAGNSNELSQDLTQEQKGGGCCPAPKNSSGHGDHHGDHHGDDCCDGGTGIQAAGQVAYNKQYADANAESKQVKPSNTNISVRVLSEGHDGDVEQSNNSYADAKAKNDNDTTQSIDQSQKSRGCGCKGGELIQAAGQSAFNWQKAKANAESKQIEPENKAVSFRFKSKGGAGYLSQANNSSASSWAANWNDLDQELIQTQGGSRP